MTSKIKVDNINKVSDDTNIIKKCGTTTTIGSGASNPIVVDGSAVTIGRCGGTVALASGATQTGFGREGSVNWQTSIKTAASFTAVSGEGYFVDTSSNVVTANLPAGAAGAIVAFSDYARNFATNKLTISPNGSEKIGGVAADLDLTVNGQALTLVYIDSTKGWINVQNAEDTEIGIPPFIAASGGTESIVCTNFKVHTFTGPGTFTVTNVGAPGGSTTIDYLVVAGGGGGGRGNSNGAGAGAGGYRESPGAASGCYTVSPLGAAPAVALPVTATGYPVTVGAGGAGGPGSGPAGTTGSNSVFAGSSTITSAGGGGGGTYPGTSGLPGGSGGGAGGPGGAIGNGNTPPTNPAQGTDGGSTPTGSGQAGGGGAIGAGSNGPPTPSGPGANGGAGATSSINGTPTARAGGGGGGYDSGPGAGAGGSGGGGAGSTNNGPGGAGSTNTGGGGGGNGPLNGLGGTGGSGIVIIRYRFQ